MTAFRKSLTLYDDYYSMMSDRIRMENYAAAIAKTVQPGDTVIDLGCGTGILSFLAVKSGAKKVYAVEKSDAIALAEKTAERNQMSDRIIFIHDNSLNVRLPEKADVLLSETLGSFGLEENTLEFTMDARNRFLKENGRMIPDGLSVQIVPAEFILIQERRDFWSNLYGIDFSAAAEEMSERMLSEEIKPENLLAKPERFALIDFYTVASSSIENTLTFEILRNGIFHGLAGWFHVKLMEGITFSTSPLSEKTHWKQAFFPSKEMFPVHAGGRITAKISLSGKNSDDSATLRYDYQYSPPA